MKLEKSEKKAHAKLQDKLNALDNEFKADLESKDIPKSPRTNQSFLSISSQMERKHLKANQLRSKRSTLRLAAIRAGSNYSPPLTNRSLSTSGDCNVALLEEIADLKKKMENRENLFFKRENDLLKEISELQGTIELFKKDREAWRETSESTTLIAALHKSILKGVETIHDRARDDIVEGKEDILRDYTTKIAKFEEKAEAERLKQEQGSNIWAKQKKTLIQQSEWAQNIALNLQKTNESLTSCKKELKQGLEIEAGEKIFMLKQLVLVKRDNILLRQKLSEQEKNMHQLRELNHRLEEEIENLLKTALKKPSEFEEIPQEKYVNNKKEKEYKNIIKRLRNLLDLERSTLRHAKEQFVSELNKSSPNSSCLMLPKKISVTRDVVTPILRDVFSFPDLRHSTSPVIK